MKLSKLVKALSVFLTLIMVFQAIPAEAAESVTSNAFVMDESSEDSGETAINADAIGEIIEKRTANTKQFRMSDGSYVAVAYDEPVHFTDSDGKWVDIDNSLQYETSKKSGDINGYVNKANDFSVKFAAKAENGKLYTLNDGKYAISFGVYSDNTKSVNNSDAKLDQSDDGGNTYKTKLEELSALKNVKSGIGYTNLWNDTDLDYVLSGKSVKDYIVIKRLRTSTSTALL